VRNRIAAAAVAAVAVAALASCTSRPQTAMSSTASVTVNGTGTDFHVVKCTQVEWLRTIQIGSDFSGAKVVIDQRGAPATAESVRIQNLAGFSGMYSQGDGGDANMSMNGEKYTIAGTATGYKTDKPSEPATATFRITAAC
jgi:ipoprotein LpqH